MDFTDFTDFVRNKNDADDLYWCATLSNGEEIYQDTQPGSTWLRLKKYVAQNGLKVEKLRLAFRSHIEHIEPQFAAGYFFIRGVMSFLDGGATYHQYVVGVLRDDGLVHISKYQTPELIVIERETRTIEQCGECLILN